MYHFIQQESNKNRPLTLSGRDDRDPQLGMVMLIGVGGEKRDSDSQILQTLAR